jgi:hypothetical protein
MKLKRIAVEIDGSGTVMGARALHDEENPGPVEYEYVPAPDWPAVRQQKRAVNLPEAAEAAITALEQASNELRQALNDFRAR